MSGLFVRIAQILSCEVVAWFFKLATLSASKYCGDFATNRNCSIYKLSSIAIQDLRIDEEITQNLLGKIAKFENCILDVHGGTSFVKGHEHFSILLYSL